MRLIIILLGIASLAFASPGDRNEERTIDHREVRAHIRALEHDDVVVRDAAAAALVKIGPAVVEPLKRAMADTSSPELHARAKEVILLCKRGGDVVDGLQLTLVADRELMTANDGVVLTTIIRNTTAEDINLCVGVSYSGVVFETGGALALADVHGTPLPSQWMVGFCGTGAYGLNVTIPANGSITYKSPLKLQSCPERIARDGRTKHVLSPGPGHRMAALPDDAKAVSRGAGAGQAGESEGAVLEREDRVERAATLDRARYGQVERRAELSPLSLSPCSGHNAPQGLTRSTTMSADSATLVRRWFEEVWNQRRSAAIDELLAKDGVIHGLGDEGRDLRGPEAFRPFQQKFLSALPDMHIKIDEVIADGDRCAVRFTCEGTHRGDQLGVPPTNRRVRFTAMAFVHCRDGKLVEGWNEIDGLGLMQQLTGPAPMKPYV